MVRGAFLGLAHRTGRADGLQQECRFFQGASDLAPFFSMVLRVMSRYYKKITRKTALIFRRFGVPGA